MKTRVDANYHFKCPKCGGSHFGSSFKDDEIESRECHDEFGRGCHHQTIAEDDWKNFKYVESTITIFESKEEYDNHEQGNR